MKQITVKLLDHKENVPISEMIALLAKELCVLVEQGVDTDGVFVSTGMFGEIRLCYLVPMTPEEIAEREAVRKS